MAPVQLEGLRRLLDGAFAGSFSRDDWDHTLGGFHVLVVDDGPVGHAAVAERALVARAGLPERALVAHAAVVERALVAADRSLRTGYVEGVATLGTHRGRGLGSIVMRKVGEIIQGNFELGALSTEVPDFFFRLGWELWKGPTYANSPSGRVRTAAEDGGILVLRTALTRDLDTTDTLACDWRSGDVW